MTEKMNKKVNIGSPRATSISAKTANRLGFAGSAAGMLAAGFGAEDDTTKTSVKYRWQSAGFRMNSCAAA